jgi:hypothetical protein
LLLDGKNYFAVSPASPIGYKLKDKKAGEEFILNEKTYQIQSILVIFRPMQIVLIYKIKNIV